MRTKLFLTAIAALITTFGVVGLVETVGATPDGSQRLRGLGDRVFLVSVQAKFGDFLVFSFPNCYVFEAGGPGEAGGYWYETAFPTDGDWTQHSNGAKTSYTVTGETLTQVGLVTPAGGTGVLQLNAISTDTGTPLTFFSVGAEIDASEVATLCPDSFQPF